jgi:hypothetical protein
MFGQIDDAAVLVSAGAAFVLAFGWYMPPVFGLRWAALTNRHSGLADSDLAANMPLKAGLWFLGFLVNALALALLVRQTRTTTVGGAVTLAVIAAVGFGAVISSWPPVHARQPIGIWLMNGGLFLLQQIVMAVTLTVWK